MIKNGNIVISQSMTKELGLYVIDDQVEEVSYCPWRLYRKYVADDYPNVCSTPMLQGKFAETLLLGSGARGEITSDLPRLRNGAKSVGQTRIEKQMDRLYGFMYANGIRLNEFNSQVRLIAKYSDNVWLRGEFDVFPAIVNGKYSIVDVKTTKDINSDFFSIKEQYIRSSANHCWGSYDQIAKNQPLFYHLLARNFHLTGLGGLVRYQPQDKSIYERLFAMSEDFSDVNFWFFVAGVGTANIDDQLAKYEYQFSAQREILLEALVSSALRRIKESIKSNFEPVPSEYLCKSCALKTECKSYVKQ